MISTNIYIYTNIYSRYEQDNKQKIHKRRIKWILLNKKTTIIITVIIKTI